ncbi:MAG TPA: hypothetical protein VK098_07685 [Beutenbergiaceae bacterium]|nr:hypothetical protein [Beutenbergiaceae bacterium]
MSKARVTPATWRIFFLLPAGLSLLAALNAGLLLLGIRAPVANWAEIHGVLMVVGFLGTLIGMERAVALRRPLGYLAPALLGIGGLLLLTPLPLLLGQLFLIEGALAFTLVYWFLWRRSHDAVVMVQLLGSVHLLIATLTWIFAPLPWLLPHFVGFLVLTITSERVELTRLHMPRSGENILVLAAAALTLAMLTTVFWPDTAIRAAALVILALTIWLGRHDVAGRFVRAVGLPRFSAAALLGGYFWLGVAACIWLVDGYQYEGYVYDAVVHSVMLGFAMSMIMAHAPIILPAVLRRPLPYRSAMWAPLGLLHLGLAIRVFAGDLPARPLPWQIGGTLNVAAVLLFLVIAVTSSVLGTRTHPESERPPAPAPSESSEI